MEQALDHIHWYQYVHQSMYGKHKGVLEVRMYEPYTSSFPKYESKRYDSERETHAV